MSLCNRYGCVGRAGRGGPGRGWDERVRADPGRVSGRCRDCGVTDRRGPGARTRVRRGMSLLPRRRARGERVQAAPGTGPSGAPAIRATPAVRAGLPRHHTIESRPRALDLRLRRARGPRGAARHGGRLGRRKLVEGSLFVSESRWEIRGGRRRRQCPRPALSPSNSTGYPGSLPLSNPMNDTSLS
jgi:hypothetical protein